jgi:hypothetical protein
MSERYDRAFFDLKHVSELVAISILVFIERPSTTIFLLYFSATSMILIIRSICEANVPMIKRPLMLRLFLRDFCEPIFPALRSRDFRCLSSQQ